MAHGYWQLTQGASLAVFNWENLFGKIDGGRQPLHDMTLEAMGAEDKYLWTAAEMAKADRRQRVARGTTSYIVIGVCVHDVACAVLDAVLAVRHGRSVALLRIGLNLYLDRWGGGYEPPTETEPIERSEPNL